MVFNYKSSDETHSFEDLQKNAKHSVLTRLIKNLSIVCLFDKYLDKASKKYKKFVYNWKVTITINSYSLSCFSVHISVDPMFYSNVKELEFNLELTKSVGLEKEDAINYWARWE